MITRIASGPDSNDPGASSFVGIPQPAGISDGDLVMVSIVVCLAGVSVTPPDATWSLVTHTDPALTVATWVFWKTALNEIPVWVFALSEPSDAQGAVVAYSGADGWEPVEAARSMSTASAAAHGVASTATSTTDEELVVFFGAADEVDYADGTDFARAVQRQHVGDTTNGTVCIQDRRQQAPVALPGFSVGFTGTNCAGATVVIVLQPSPSISTIDDVYGRIIGALPPGVERVYDLSPSGDFYKLFRSIALLAKVVAFDLIDLLNIEKFFANARYLLPDWENVFDLAGTPTARAGTVPQRQAQVVSSWRAVAGQGSSLPVVSAILGPLLGYFPTTPVRVLGGSRSDLDIAHSYSPGEISVLPDGTTSYFWTTIDGGMVSSAGVRVTLEYGPGTTGRLIATVTAPDGTTKAWNVTIADQSIDLLWGKEFAGAMIWPGKWSIALTNLNLSGPSYAIIPTVIVEGVTKGLNDGQNTGAAVFHWGAYADPAHIGESGVPADFNAARRAIARLNFADKVGTLLQSIDPYPGVTTGIHAAIPGECCPSVGP